MPAIALLTDYGTHDHYAAALKGVILGICPGAPIVDVSHEVEPFQIADGAFVLRQVWAWFPEGTIFVAVVDPDVGSPRRILLAKYAGRFVIAPDNGLLTWLHRDFQVEALHAVENRTYFLPNESSTFHGRDILAPVAAHLANGVEPRSFGPPASDPQLLPIPYRAERDGRGWVGRIIYVDGFGTLVSNVHRDQLPETGGDAWRVRVNGYDVGPIRRSFHEVAAGSPVAFIGSSDFLEVAINQGSAVSCFGTADAVRVELRPPKNEK